MSETASPQSYPAPPRLVHPGKEPVKAYDTFVAYYNLGEARSCEKLSQKYGKQAQNYRKMRSRWWWDERIAAQKEEIDAMYRTALRRKADAMAERVLSLRVEILEEQLAAVKALGERARMINSLPLVERTVTSTSPDGKTEHITLKPVRVRATDGGRLLLMQDTIIRSLTAQTAPPERKAGTGPDGMPTGRMRAPRVELYIDNGDGTRGKMSDQPPVDVYSPDNDFGYDEEGDPEGSPLGEADSTP